MTRKKAGKALVKDLIAETEKIVREYCNPDNPAGFLTRREQQEACRRLNTLTSEWYAWARPQIGHVEAFDVREALGQRTTLLLKYADAERHQDPNASQNRKQQGLEVLRYEYNTTDLPLIYDALRDAAGCRKKRSVKTPRKRHRAKRTVPTPNQGKAYNMHLKGKSYREIGRELGVSHQTAGEWIKLAKAHWDKEQRKGRSVNASQALPTDRHDQVAIGEDEPHTSRSRGRRVKQSW